MDYSNLPPRSEPVALSGNAAASLAPAAMSTRAETTRPVLAAEAARDPTALKSQTMQPLDTFKVGDSDYVPVPPEPPREAAVLAIIANALKLDMPEPEVPAPDATRVEAKAVAPSPDPPDHGSEPQAVPATEPLTEALQTIASGPENPTVDIMR